MAPSPREETPNEVPKPSPDTGLREGLLDALSAGVIASAGDGRLLYANPAALALWGLPAAPVGAFVRSAFPLRHEDGRALSDPEHPIARARAEARPAPDRLSIRVPGRETVVVELTVQGLDQLSPAPGGTLMVVRPYCESRREAHLRTYVSDFEILTEVSRQLADVQDAEEAASIICTVAVGLTGAIAVFLWEAHDGDFILRWQEGVVGGDALFRLTETSKAGASRAIAERQTLVDGPPANADATAGKLGVTPGTAWHEPLIRSGKATGALSIVWPGVLTDTERPGWLIEALAHHAATALERAYLVRRLNDAARTDPLTGLANRRVWSERLDHELSRAEREGTPLSLVLIDMDRFKSYNDRFGHPQGDVLLAEAAAAWATELRTTDLLARVGGEEFAVLLPSCPIDDARLVAERLRRVTPRDETCSLGVAMWDEAMTASQLYAVADAALYRAKENGRNQVQVGVIPGTDALPLAS
jgi:diguanylate cyclase (GGDEF)-like protein